MSRTSAESARARLAAEALEDRSTPATITVTTAVDDLTPNDGTVSLREAITAVNAGNDLGDPDITAQAPGTFGINDRINFAVPGTGVVAINLVSALPTVVKPLTVDGYTQAGAAVNTLANGDNAVILIRLNGTSAGAAVDGLTLGTGSGGSTVRGLDVADFKGNGIVVRSNGNSVLGNFVGVDPTGLTRAPNGTFPSSGDGIRVENASDNKIGSANPADRNVVSGNAIDGIHVVGTLTSPATGNLIQGNFVGVAADGKSSVGNRTEPAPATGKAEGNNLFGIEISGGNQNTVGGTAAGARNVVGFNGSGIEVDNGGQQNVIQGNFVGVGADGTSPAGNLLHGIDLRSSNGFSAPLGPAQPNEPGTSNNLIGGTAAGAGNLVAFNGTGGVAVFGNPVAASGQSNVGNAVEGNSIFENGRSYLTAASAPTPLLGIDLTNGFLFPRDDGATANDSKGHGAANDPNNFQNFPVLTSGVIDGGTTAVGSLHAAPNTTYRVEFFANDPDPLGLPAEGQTFLGFADVTTDAGGTAAINTAFNTRVAPGRTITATATDPAGNTSEFSAGVAVRSAVVVAPAALPGGQVGAAYTQTVTASGPPGPFTFAVTAGALPGGLTLGTGGVLSGTPTAAGAFTFTVTATNAASDAGSRDYTLTVGPPPPLVASGPADGTALVFPANPATGQYPTTPAATVSPFGAVAADVRSATGDVNGDGFADLILVTGPGVAPVKFAVISGADNSTVLVPPTDPFGNATFSGGGFVAAGDFDHDGRAEWVITPDQGGGPNVVIYSLVGTTATVRTTFLGIDDPNFRGGARAAVGDVNADGTPDLAVAAGFLGGPRVALFDGTTVFGTPTRLVGDFFAFGGTDATTLRNGVFVALGDVDGDGFADLIAGGGPGGGPRVLTISGKVLMNSGVDAAQAAPVMNFFVAGNGNDRGGVRVAAVAADADQKADVAVGSGEGLPSRVRVYLGKDITSTAEPTAFQDLDPFGATLPGGVFVG
jgi:CSLREA domain-containing protein